MTPLETLASLPSIHSRKLADTIVKELFARGLVIVPASQVVTNGSANMELARSLMTVNGAANGVAPSVPSYGASMTVAAPPSRTLVSPRAAATIERAMHPVDYLDV